VTETQLSTQVPPFHQSTIIFSKTLRSYYLQAVDSTIPLDGTQEYGGLLNYRCPTYREVDSAVKSQCVGC